MWYFVQQSGEPNPCCCSFTHFFFVHTNSGSRITFVGSKKSNESQLWHGVEQQQGGGISRSRAAAALFNMGTGWGNSTASSLSAHCRPRKGGPVVLHPSPRSLASDRPAAGARSRPASPRSPPYASRRHPPPATPCPCVTGRPICIIGSSEKLTN